ncbi:hypothetical protein [Actimicrobium antarcticum]
MKQKSALSVAFAVKSGFFDEIVQLFFGGNSQSFSEKRFAAGLQVLVFIL